MMRAGTTDLKLTGVPGLIRAEATVPKLARVPGMMLAGATDQTDRNPD